MSGNPITPAGHARLLAEYHALFNVERPKIVEMVSWAAGNGDRSENGDYIYGRKRLREIDGALNRLSTKLKEARVVDPADQPDKTRVYFGARVMIIATNEDSDDAWKFVTIVGDDEAEAEANRVGWNSPMARDLRGATAGDVRVVELPSKRQEFQIVEVSYPS